MQCGAAPEISRSDPQRPNADTRNNPMQRRFPQFLEIHCGEFELRGPLENTKTRLPRAIAECDAPDGEVTDASGGPSPPFLFGCNFILYIYI